MRVRREGLTSPSRASPRGHGHLIPLARGGNASFTRFPLMGGTSIIDGIAAMRDSLGGDKTSRFYRFMYAVGITPWEADAENVAPELRSALDRIEDGLMGAPFGTALDLGCGRGTVVGGSGWTWLGRYWHRRDPQGGVGSEATRRRGRCSLLALFEGSAGRCFAMLASAPDIAWCSTSSA